MIGKSQCNYYVPVPVDANNPIEMGELCEVVKCICCGVIEDKVETFRLQDVKKSNSQWLQASNKKIV